MSEAARENTIYSPEDVRAIREQIRMRWLAVGIPCVLLLAVLVFSLVKRVEAVTTISTILIGAILIFCWDMFLKPLCCYRKYLQNVLYGRTHEVELPFVALSEDVNVVDGVPCRAMTCMDSDAKGRPYERLFYFDALKTFPDFQPGETVRVTHHDLIVADVTRV